jgi:uncharacterized protein YjbJ (UPF0337 family)
MAMRPEREAHQARRANSPDVPGFRQQVVSSGHYVGDGGSEMGHDHDRPDDSNAPRHKPGSVAEETSATGQRVKGAIKEGVGIVTGNESVENKGDRENAAGKDRQNKNDAV